MAMPQPPLGPRARAAPHDLEQGGGGGSVSATARRAARGTPAAALLALPGSAGFSTHVELGTDGRGTLLLFVLLIFVINAGLFHTLLWFLLLGVAAGACLRAVLLAALLHADPGALAALGDAVAADAAEAARDTHAGAQPGGRVDPLVLQMQLMGRELTDRDYNALLALDEDGGGGAPRPRGLTPEQLAALPTHAAGGADAAGASGAAGGAGGRGGGVVTCAVCLEDAAHGEVLRTLPCLHQFHAACIDVWLASSPACPVCKQAAVATEDRTSA